VEVQEQVLATNKNPESPSGRPAHHGSYRRGTGSGAFQRASSVSEHPVDAIIEYTLIIKPAEDGYNNGRSSVLRIEGAQEAEGWLADIKAQIKVNTVSVRPCQPRCVSRVPQNSRT
jgi:hypothetical protein